MFQVSDYGLMFISTAWGVLRTILTTGSRGSLSINLVVLIPQHLNIPHFHASLLHSKSAACTDAQEITQEERKRKKAKATILRLIHLQGSRV